MTTCILKNICIIMLNLKSSHDKKYTQDLSLGRAFSYTGRALLEQSWTLKHKWSASGSDSGKGQGPLFCRSEYFPTAFLPHITIWCIVPIYYLPSHQMIHIFLALLPMRDRFVHAVRDMQQCASFLYCVLLRRCKM